jgi:hypothetical protein
LKNRYLSVSLRNADRISNRQVIDELRLMQQQMRGLDARMSKIESKQERLALSFMRCAMSVSDQQLLAAPSEEVRRAG